MSIKSGESYQLAFTFISVAVAWVVQAPTEIQKYAFSAHKNHRTLSQNTRAVNAILLTEL